MYFLLVIMAGGFFILGAVFCMALIGGAPWSEGAEFAPTKFLGTLLSNEEISIGLTHVTLGAVWLLAWFGFLVSKWSIIFGSEGMADSLAGLENAIQFVLGLSLIFSGVAVLKQWRRWRQIYVFSVGVVLCSLMVGVTVILPHGTVGTKLIYILAGTTFVIVGALTMGLFLVDRGVKSSKTRLQQKKSP